MDEVSKDREGIQKSGMIEIKFQEKMKENEGAESLTETGE